MRIRIGILCGLLALSFCAFSAGNFSLKNGDRVVFYGDSITDQRLYTVITETYVATRYPDLDVSFVHSGWGGDKVSGGGGGPVDLRLQRDVVAYKPTVMTIMLGMNDGLYRAESETTDKAFFDGYRHIVSTVQSALPGIRITAIEPSPYDDVTREPNFPGGYNEVMISFGKWIANYGKQNGLNVADLNTGVVDMLRRAEELDPVHAKEIIPDRVHPSFPGHLILAEELLKAWHARPVVAAVTIDASGSSPAIKSSDHATISGLANQNGLQWTELDDALPLPFLDWEQMRGSTLPLVLRSSNVSEDLNDEPLKVIGLKSGVYTLKIDGESVGAFNNDQLSRGVNLALLNTPMVKQANDVYDLTVSHCSVHNDAWRNMAVPLAKYNFPQTSEAVQSVDALETAILQKRHAAAQPLPHKYELSPLS
ncbi:MAG TPA: SGNH/GDSL hydrolase family protein [Bryobacteraceae bacterium]|nr:SGNH/GDSL hydrolase family protein [Bryobacteraceae bacterium]